MTIVNNNPFFQTLGLFFLFISIPSAYANQSQPEEKGRIELTVPAFAETDSRISLHDDSLHRFSFRYADRERGLKPWIAPGLLIAGGTTLHLMPDVKKRFHEYTGKKLFYDGNLDDKLQIAPLAAVYLLNLSGIKGKNNFGNSTAIAIKSIILNSFITNRMKVWINAPRPNLAKHAFPSGHTSTAFTFAHFMHREFGERSPWYSVGAYTSAAVVGMMRMGKNVHWLPDVLAGAGVGILSTELIYLTHQYKWDNDHMKRFNIFPFQQGNQKGLTMVYTF